MCLEITLVDEDGNVVEVQRSPGLREFAAWARSNPELAPWRKRLPGVPGVTEEEARDFHQRISVKLALLDFG